MGPASVRDEMGQINDLFEKVVVNGDFEALDRIYTKDARVFPPGAEMISGRDNIKEFWKGAAAALGVKSVKLNTLDAEMAGDSIIEIGRARITGNSPMEVKYVVVWKREDGALKYHVDIWNAVS